MKHLALIQAEFLKTARKWDDMTMQEQKKYLKLHPKSKRRITAEPKTKDPDEPSSGPDSAEGIKTRELYKKQQKKRRELEEKEKQRSAIAEQREHEFSESVNDINSERPDSAEGIKARESYIEERKKRQQLTELSDQFKNDGYETDLSNINENKIHVTNKKGYGISFKRKDNGGFDAVVQGYSSDIDLGDVGKSYKDLKEIAKGINKAWMKEYDPEGHRW